MISTYNLLILSWYTLLNENISVPVYRTNIPKDEAGNYVLIRKESEREQPIGSRKWMKSIVIIEIVTKHPNSVEDETAGEIDNEITQLLAPGVKENGLPAQAGMQISNVYKDSVTCLDEYDGSNYIYRHITRYRHDITQN
jgi:hypothetical protein